MVLAIGVKGKHSLESPSLGRGTPIPWSPRGSEFKNAKHREGQIEPEPVVENKAKHWNLHRKATVLPHPP